jgi:hypothetical protein
MTRVLVALLLVLCGLRQAEAAITPVTHIAAQAINGAVTTTREINTTGATLLVMSLSVLGSGSSRTVSDNKGNTWVQITQQVNGNNNVTLYYVQNPTVGTGHTFSGAGTWPTIIVQAFAGTDTTAAVDQFNHATNGAALTVQPGSITPTANGEVLVTAAVCGNAQIEGNDAITDSFVITDVFYYVSSVAVDVVMAYRVQPTAAAINPTWTLSSGTNCANTSAVIASFKEAASPPPPPPTPPASVIFLSGFEMGYPPINNTDGDTAFVFGGAVFSSAGSGTGKHGGAWYMDESNVGLATETTMFTGGSYATPTIACRYYVQIMQQTTTVQVVDNAFQLFASSAFKQMELGLDANRKMYLHNLGGFPFVQGNEVLAPFGTWNRIDVIYDMASGGVGQVYVNGVLDINSTHTGTTGNVVTMRVHGIQGGTPTGNLRYDDFLCTTGLVQPPDGRVIVRQGVAGTPLHNSWTTVNCSGGIDTCWSNTPMTTVSNAHSTSTTSALEQTMKVWPFSTVQSGHGTETLQGSTTVNAVQIAMVARTSNAASGGNGISIRRYVGGVLVGDYPVTLTTADAFIKSPIFTETVPNLDLYEIGVLKPATGVALDQTVEDMWVLVDCAGPGCIPLSATPVRHKVTQD